MHNKGNSSKFLFYAFYKMINIFFISFKVTNKWAWIICNFNLKLNLNGQEASWNLSPAIALQHPNGTVTNNLYNKSEIFIGP